MKRQYLALLCVCAFASAQSAGAAEYQYDAGLAVVNLSHPSLDGTHGRIDYRLMGAARLQTGASAAYGPLTCNGHVTKSILGKTVEDASDCVWTDRDGDRITWRYVADQVNSGPGYQRAHMQAVSGSGKWQGISGTIVTDVMVKPEFPNALVNYVVGKGELSAGGRP